MMNDKEILANAPEGATHVFIDIEYHPTYVKFDMEGRRYFWYYPMPNHWYEMEKMPDNDIHSLADIRALVEKDERIAELENERDELHAYVVKVILFVTRVVEKLKGIPEFKPTGDVLNRVLMMTPKTALQAHNLEQKSLGVRELRNSDGFWKYSNSRLRAHARNFEIDLIEQAKQLREGVE